MIKLVLKPITHHITQILSVKLHNMEVTSALRIQLKVDITTSTSCQDFTVVLAPRIL